jgi:hypothetical protein
VIAPEILDQIANAADSFEVLDEAALEIFKGRWPELRFTLCSDDDMPARMSPILHRERCNLYLVGGGEHCLSLTTDPEQAIGVVLAQVEAE